jgi:hypothetical protein
MNGFNKVEYNTRPERLVREKYSSLLGPFLNQEEYEVLLI